MAATLTADQELAYFSFPIEKVAETEDGDVVIWGKATDGTLDGDLQVVDPEWSGAAIKSWLATGGNIRVQHNAQRDPAGKGLEVEVTPDGSYVKSLICEPVAKDLVRKGVLRDYSVGISHPKIDPDPVGKAVNGVIRGYPDGRTKISEISLVDRGSNFNARFQLVKAASDGTPEYVGDVRSSGDVITKDAEAELTKAAAADTVPVDLPSDVSVSFSPADLAKLLKHRAEAEERETDLVKAIAEAENAVYKRDIDTATRRRLAKEDRALPDGSYPIENHQDAENAVTLALSGHGDVGAAKKLIRRIAREEGWHDILDRLDGKGSSDKAAKPGKKCKTCKGSGKIRDGHMDCPGCDGSGRTEKAAKAERPAAGDGDGPPPEGALHHDDHQDDDSDSEADEMDKAAQADVAKKPPKVKCPSCGKKTKAASRFCRNCGRAMNAAKASKPTPGDGAEGEHTEPVPAHREPDGAEVEAFEDDAGLQEGDEHEHAEQPTSLEKPTLKSSFEEQAALRLKSIRIPHSLGVLHDVTCPGFHPADVDKCHPGASPSDVDVAEWQAKALDAAAGAPLEEAQALTRLWQAAQTVKDAPPGDLAQFRMEAHKAFRDANPGPGRAPTPAEISPRRCNRPYITAGHAADSPGNTSGVHREPVRVPSGQISASQFGRGYLDAGHAADSPANKGGYQMPYPQETGRPQQLDYTGLAKDNARAAMNALHDHIAQTFPDVCPMDTTGRHPVPAAAGISKAEQDRLKAEKAAKKAEKLEKKLRKARKAAGFTPAPDPADQISKGIGYVKATYGTVTPAALKAAVADAQKPLLERLEAQQKMLDALADQPDPAVTAYKGAAFTRPPMNPAGPSAAAQSPAEQAQAEIYRALHEQWRTSPDPAQRVAAEQAMAKMRGIPYGKT